MVTSVSQDHQYMFGARNLLKKMLLRKNDLTTDSNYFAPGNQNLLIDGINVYTIRTIC